MMMVNEIFVRMKELLSGHVKCFKGAIPLLGRSLFLIFVLEAVPSIAYAHSGVEPFMPCIMLLGLIIGLITGVICALRHLSIGKVVLPSFGIYLAILVLGGFLFQGGASWPDISIILIFSIVLGGVGFIPLSIGIITMSFILNRGIYIFKKSSRRP